MLKGGTDLSREHVRGLIRLKLHCVTHQILQ